jgi:integrase
MLDALRQPGANRRGRTGGLRKVDGKRVWVPNERPSTTGLGDKSIRHTKAVLHSALEWALEHGDVPRNVAALVKLPKPKRRAKAERTDQSWTAEQLDRFMAVAEKDRLHALWRLAAYTGMRRSELLGLHWEQVDLVAGTVEVNRRAIRLGYRMIEVEGTKTERSERTIVLDPGTVAVLKAWRKTQREDRMRARPAGWPPTVIPGESGPVFTDALGRLVTGDHLSNRYHRLVKAAGVPEIRFHDLRHTHGSLLIEAGTPITVVAERLGHSQTSTTLNIYAHAIKGADDRAAAAFAALVDGSSGG